MDQLTASQYAVALFDLALEENALKKYEADVQSVLAIFDEHPDLGLAYASPEIGINDKIAFIDALFGNMPLIAGLMATMAKKNRASLFEDTLIAFLGIIDEHFRRTEAELVSATPITEKQQKDISDILSKKLNKQVRLKTSVDPSLIGGFVVTADGVVFDTTIKQKLADTATFLKSASQL